MVLGAFQTERLTKTLSEMLLWARLAQFWGAPMPPVSSRERPRAPRERPNDVPERPRSLSGASPERPGIACDGACLSDWAPKAVLERLGLDFGLSGEVRVISWDASCVRFSHVLALHVTPCLRACDNVRPTKRKKQKKRGAFAFEAFRPAFGCSCSPTRPPRFFP